MEDFSRLIKIFNPSILGYFFNFTENQYVTLKNGYQVELTLNQKEVYNHINKIIEEHREIRYKQGENNLLDVEQLLLFWFNGESKVCLANKYNKICGGSDYFHTLTNDILFDFIAYQIGEIYPKILSKNFIHSYDSLLDSNRLIEIVGNDEIFKLLKKSDTNEYILSASLFDKNDSRIDQIERSLEGVFSSIFSVSFENCMYKLEISQKALIKEIKEGINFLRGLALKKTLSCSTFVGVHGIGFCNFSEIVLDDELIIRSISNKDLTWKLSSKTSSIIANHPDVKFYGVSVEGKHILKSKSKKEKRLQPRYVDMVGETLLNEAIEKIEIFYLAILILKNKISCLETSFKSVGYYFKTSYYGDAIHTGKAKMIPIYENEVNEIKKIYHLIRCNLKNNSIYNTIYNLKSAMLKGNEVNESIMSGFYAWESMFTYKKNTTKYVCNAISSYIDVDKERIEDLYDRYRSSRSHGELFKLNENENIYKIQKEVIDIGIKCLKKLIEDEKLVKLNASSRAKSLMQV